MKAIVLFILLIASCTVNGQKRVYQGFPSLIWPKLYDISYVAAKDEFGDYEKPVFSQPVKSLQKKVIVLPGYMVPLDDPTGSKTFMLSSLPLNACFFCGVGGPETVVEVKLKSATTYIEKPVEVRGVFRLNESDPDQMIYVLEEAEILGTLDF